MTNASMIRVLNKHAAKLLLVVLGVVMVNAAVAQDLYRVTGFRSAEFGMNEQQVFEAIQRDFGFGEDQIEFLHNERESTYLMHIVLPSLEPGPGEAHVYYILGATSLTLTHVNVLWITSDSPSETERDHIGIAGMQLTRYFLERNWPPGNVRTGVMRDSGEVVPFVGMDSTGAGVEVLVKGIPVTDGGGQTTTPEGEAMLRVGYSSRYGSPDVIRVEPGEF